MARSCGPERVCSAREVLATNDLAEECIATPAIAEGRLLVRTAKALYSFGET